jgi:RNA polymerase sigma-70 factor, ECF subfamily
MNKATQERRRCRYGAPGGRLGSSASANATERELLEAAHNGDEHAFCHLVETHRAALLAHRYRMLGSVQDAKDALQDTLLHAWRGLSGFDGRSALRWRLYRIATNACLDAITRRRKRSLPIVHGLRDGAAREALPADALWMVLYPDQLLGPEDGYAPEARYEQREAVELAFVLALQHLPPRQRAVLVLRDVLDFSAKEVSRSLRMTMTSVNSALQRARRAVEERVPEKSRQATVHAGDASVHDPLCTAKHGDADDPPAPGGELTALPVAVGARRLTP